MRIPYVNTSLAQDVRTTLYLVPLWWVLGLGIVIYHAVALLLFMKVVAGRASRGGRVQLPVLALWLVPFALIYALSLSINAGHAADLRVLAGVYNLSYWVMGIALVVAIYNALEPDDIPTLARPLAFIVSTAGLLSMLALLMWMLGAEQVRFQTPVQALIPESLQEPLVVWSTQVSILMQDWFTGQAWPRTSIYSPYPTSLAALVVMSVPIIVVVRRYERRAAWRVGLALAVALGCFALLMTWSRSSMAALILGLMVYFIVSRKLALVTGLACLAGGVAVLPFMDEFTSWVGGLREGSTTHRFDLYEYTVLAVLDRSPLLGLGIKPRILEFNIPIGSHSMYLGALLKGGVLGLAFFLGWLLVVAISWLAVLRRPLPGGSRALLAAVGGAVGAMSFWMLFEDLDAPQLVAFVYFTLVGSLAVMIRAVREQVVTDKRSRPAARLEASPAQPPG